MSTILQFKKDIFWGGAYIISVAFLLKMSNFSAILKKYQTAMEGYLTKQLIDTLPKCQGHRSQEKTDELSWIPENKEK